MYRYGIFECHTYLKTKTPNNYELIHLNRTILDFQSLYKSKEPISNFYFKKWNKKRFLGYPSCPTNAEKYISCNIFLTM